MSVTLNEINALFKQCFIGETTETIKETPYFLKMVKTVRVSKEYTVPINLKPGHSMRYAQNPFEKVAYQEYSGPHIKEAKGTITAKFFKVEVPLGVIDSLNKSTGRGGISYETARYFIQDAVRTNQLLAELSFMYGELGLPTISSVSSTFGNKNLPTNQKAFVYDMLSTSDAILRIINNSKIWIVKKDETLVKSSSSPYEYKVLNIDFTESKILLESSNEAIAALPTSEGFRLCVATQLNNDNLGLFQLMNKKGIVLGIDDGEYVNWKPSTFDSGNDRLTIRKVKDAASSLITRGGVMDEDLYLFISQDTWDDLSTEIDASRQFDYTYNQEMNVLGQRSVGIIHSNGMIYVIYHPLMKRGMAFLLTNPKDPSNLINLTTEKIMEFENNKNFTASENASSAYVIGKMYFTPFTRDRRKHLLIKNIVNTV